MKQKLIEFLKLLEGEAMSSFSHSITYAKIGGKDELTLNVYHEGERPKTFILEDGDLEKEPAALVQDIAEYLFPFRKKLNGNQETRDTGHRFSNS